MKALQVALALSITNTRLYCLLSLVLALVLED